MQNNIAHLESILNHHTYFQELQEEFGSQLEYASPFVKDRTILAQRILAKARNVEGSE